MIKILRNKFLICMFLLVVSVIITSSCYAMTVDSADNLPFSVDSIYSNSQLINYFQNNCGYTPNENNTTLLVYYSNNKYYAIVFDGTELDYIYNGSGANYYYGYLNSNGTSMASVKCVVLNGYNSLSYYVGTSGSTVTYGEYLFASGSKVYDCSTISVYNDNGTTLIYKPTSKMVVVTHEFQSDTSAKVNFTINNAPENSVLKYSLSGIKLNMDLTAPLELENPVIYSPGVTNLVVKPNTKVYWALYDTDESCLLSDVYQVPEYNVQVENANKSIEYKLEYSKDYTYAVLTASLKNGEFSDKLVYSEFSALNISTGKLEHGYQNFYGSLKITTNGKYYFYALDSFGNVFKTVIITVSDIFNFVDSDFSYTLKDESTLHGGYKLHITPKVNNWSSKVDIKYTIKLTAGHQFATVTIPTEYPELSYVDNIFGSYGDDISPGAPTYFNGRVMSGDSIRVFSPSNNLEDLKGEITFKIYKKSDNSLIFEESYTLNVNAFTAGNTTDGTAGDVTGTLPEDSENSEDFTDNDYGDVSWSDVEDYVGTSGSFWSIVKNILNNLPKWITAPIFFFISAVVAIALIKAILP